MGVNALVDAEEELDMASPEGCSDNPLAKLVGLLKSGVERIRVKARKSVLPPQLAEILAEKYGYVFRVEKWAGEAYEALFSKK